jgi:phage terminase large subunit-like protein
MARRLAVTRRPPRPLLTVIGVDPADSGEGDACGLVAASMTAEGVVAVIADQSAPMTSDQWARAAVELAADVGASEIAVEGFAARETYTRVVNDAVRRYGIDRPIRVTSWPPRGSGRGGGDALARSAASLQALEVGTCRLAGYFPTFEAAAVTWHAGQHQPDGLAALVVAHDVLVHAAGRQMYVAIPDHLSGSAAGIPTVFFLQGRFSASRPLCERRWVGGFCGL